MGACKYIIMDLEQAHYDGKCKEYIAKDNSTMTGKKCMFCKEMEDQYLGYYYGY